MTTPKSEYNSPSLESNLLRNGLEVKIENVTTNEGGANANQGQNPPATDPIDWKAKFEEAEAKLKAIPVIEKVLTPEEIEAKLKEEENEVLTYAVTEKKLSALDFEKFKASQNIAAKDFVFERYKAEKKAENPDLGDSEIKEDFEAEYGFASVNENVQKRAQKRVELEAKEIQATEFAPFKGLKEELATVKTIKAKAKVYNEFVSTLNPVVSVSTTIEGIAEPIIVDVDYSDIVAEIKKELSTKELFSAFTAEGVDTEKAISSYIETEAKIRKQDLVVSQLVDKAYKEKMKLIKLGSIAPLKTEVGVKSVDTPNPEFDFINKAVAAVPKQK